MKNPTYYETIVKSKIWQDWTKYAEDNLLFDMPESIECGWLSDKHWEAFIKWVRQQIKEELEGLYGFSQDDWEKKKEEVRQQTLEEAIASVPKEVFCQTQPMATDYGNIQSALLVEGVNKWNACRQQTLSNLQALKDKNK